MCHLLKLIAYLIFSLTTYIFIDHTSKPKPQRETESPKQLLSPPLLRSLTNKKTPNKEEGKRWLIGRERREMCRCATLAS